MKIYHRKNFINGVCFCILGIGLLITSFINEFSTKDIILVITMFLFGISAIVRSLSKQYTKEDIIEEKDERNQFVNLKSKAKAFKLTQNFAIIIGFVLTIYGAIFKENIILGVGVTLSFLWSISMIFEICTYFYYEKHD